MTWIALVGSTDKILYKVCRLTHKNPSVLFTNDNENNFTNNLTHKNINTLVIGAESEDVQKFLQEQSSLSTEKTIITTHDYKGLISDIVKDKFKVFASVRGLISTYPELKGYDPVLKAWYSKPKIIGCEIYQLQPNNVELLVKRTTLENTAKSYDEMCGLIDDMVLKSWVSLIKEYKK